MIRTIVKGGFVAAALMATVTSASAQEMIYGGYLSPKHGVMANVIPDAFAGISEGAGAQKWRVAPGGQVLTARNTLEGVGNGLADAGFVIPVYTRAQLAANSVLFDYYGSGSDVIAGTGATLEVLFKHCPACLKEYDDANTVLLAATNAAPNHLMCGPEVRTAADVVGKKVRALGPGASMVRILGGTPVSMSPPEGAQAIQRGTIDCVLGPIAWLESAGYLDVVNYIIDQPVGFSKAHGVFVMGKESFGRLSPEQQSALKGQMPQISAEALINANLGKAQEATVAAKAKGIQFVPADDAFIAALAEFTSQEAGLAAKSAEKVGFSGSAEILAKYEELYPKWEALAKEINGDPAKFAAALAEHVYND